ncbi:hypothetical protein [Mycoplasmoides pirum]|uniref:hypothetical protein n=1 Tax=Mycoplasmoides pirum TaxID=2122 RepID=UPI0004805D01|nr:hypothetical protein [Mycoplasmoides pirum]
MKTNNFSKNKKIDDSFNDLESFYSVKRNNSTNVFSIINNTILNEEKEEKNMNTLDSFYIPVDDEKTHKIFDDVISYQNKVVEKKNKNKLNNNITDEILGLDLPNDDIFVKDVIESYEESFTSPKEKSNSKNEDRKLLTLTDELDAPNLKNESFTEFVSTKIVKEDNPIINDDDRFNSFKESLESAHANQDELHKSIQIALNDVKKHRDLDLIVDNQEIVENNNNNDPSKTIHIESDNNFDSDDDDDEKEPTINHLNESATYAINFKAKDDDFFFIDNTNNSRKFSDHLTSLQNVENTSNVIENSISEERVKELVQEQIQEEISKIQKTQKIYEDIENEFNDSQNKILEAQTKMIEKAREELISERQKILEEAENEREQLLSAAKNEIELERERLKFEQEQYKQLKNQLEDRIQENKEFVEKQRLALLEAAQKEKERLLNNARIQKENLSNDVLNEIKDAIDDLRNQQQSNQTKKIEIHQEPILEKPNETSEEYKKIFNELSNKLDDIQKNITIAIKQEEKEEEEIDPEMEAINANRSYTEKIIDDIESDDYNNEEIIPIPTIPLEFSKEININSSQQLQNPQQPQELKTIEITNDVDVMRKALKNSSNNTDFDFDEKRKAYENEKIKEEIKREILQEMSLLTKDAVGLNTTIPAIDFNNENDDGVTSSIQNTTEIEEIKDVTLHSSNKVPELVNRNYKQNANFATKMYDFDLFDDLNMERFEFTTPTKKIDSPSKITTFPIDITNEILSSQFSRPDLASVLSTPITSNKLDSILKEPENDEKPKSELRRARLALNKKRQDNLSSSELIKSIAKEIKKKSSLKK